MPHGTTHTTAVVLIPPAEAWPPIQALRRRYDRQFRRWMPHVTLLYPFRPRAAFAELAPQFAAALASLAPFEVSLATFGSFAQRGGQYALWLAPEPVAPLVGLQTTLWQVVPECDGTRRHGVFTPHLSVGQARGAAAQREILAEMRAHWQPLRFTASEVALIWRGEPPDDVFRVERTVALKG